MAFLLFLLLNFVFIVRPDDLVTALTGSRLYLWVFIACLLFSWRDLSLNLKLNKLFTDPITCCILLYGVIQVLSNFINIGAYHAREKGIEYLKIVFYYLMFISLVTTPYRLRTFLKALVLITLVMTAIVLLDHHEIIRVEAIEPIMQNEYEDGAITDTYPRLRYLGTLEDPNDLSMILGIGMILSVYLYYSGHTILRLLWAIPFVSFTYLLILTQSRGGLLGLAGAVTAFFASRLGWRRALPLAGLAVPALLLVIGGRQANFSLSGGTGQDRLRIWSDGLTLLSQLRNLFVGIGVDQYQEEMGHVAHNSYVQAFVETGILGGVIFSGMLLLGFGVVFCHRRKTLRIHSPLLEGMYPFLLAVLADYLVCMFSLSRNYVVTTYMILGICTVYVTMYHDESIAKWYKMDFRMMVWICGLGLCVFVVLKLFLMSFVQFGT